jgi:glycosyltransferase involved in cell wall biosynthesis/ribosomal protein S18 acetylase RimI-like enzyme
MEFRRRRGDIGREHIIAAGPGVPSKDIGRTRLVHVTTTDISLSLLLGPQLRAFSEAGYEVLACSAPGPYVHQLESWGLAHVPLRHATRSTDPAADVRLLGELVSVFRQLRPDIVHTHNPKPGVLGRLAARAVGVPVVVNTVHGLYAQESDRWLRRGPVYGAELLASRYSDAELVQNPEDLETLALLGIPRHKLHLLGNGVDLGRFSPDETSPADRAAVRAEFGAGTSDFVVGVVGRLVWEKGYRELFAAAERWKEEAPHLVVVVVGPADPDKADGLDNPSIEAAERNGVRFLGSRDDMERLYSGFDTYVLASHREGFPRSAMEAAAVGLPVVATDIRGCRQVVDHEVTGLLIPVRDAAALAEAVLRLAASPSERDAMGSAARAKALREFDQQHVIDLTLETYDRLLGSAGLREAGRPGIELRFARVADAPRLASLHRSELQESFLASLGQTFLTRLYRRIICSRDAFAIVASTDDLPIAGFLAATENTAALYRRFLARDGLVAGAAALPELIRSSRHVLETLHYGSAPSAPLRKLPAAELLSVAVTPEVRGRGVGRALVNACQLEWARRGVATTRVVVAASNATAIGLYHACGFRPAEGFELHRGERSEVLVWP